MNNKFLATLAVVCLLLSACSTQKKLAKLAGKTLLQQPEVATAHVGISLMDVSTGKYLYNYQGDKYFIPASNTKLLTCYAAMKHLGDSLVGLRYSEQSSGMTRVQATGDPTLLHPDFKIHPVLDFLKRQSALSWHRPPINSFRPLGRGWAWDDYQDDYMSERSELPVYGNCVWFSIKNDITNVVPRFFKKVTIHPYPINKRSATAVTRAWEENSFEVSEIRLANTIAVPFKTLEKHLPVAWELLEDTLGKKFGKVTTEAEPDVLLPGVVHSQPTDTLLKIMMHRSDNFFAEQSLLMVSNEMLGRMNDTDIIDSLLKTDYAAMPQSPKWVDGSGLSRYNLITPQDFVWLLQKMKQDFSWQRITGILQTGGQGTLSNYYKKYAGRIYAKTGTLSNNVALSGYLLTQKGKILAFSVIVNNHKAAVSNIRGEVEAFLGTIIEKY